MWTETGRPPPTLTTPRLFLRAPAATDAAAIAALANDLAVARWLSRMPHPYGLDDARAYIADVVPKEWAWLIAEREDRRVLGVISLWPAASADAVELGYWIGRPFWGQGYATEAAGAVVAHGRKALAGRPFVASFAEDNPASARVLAKLGFAPVGRSERHIRSLGVSRPHIDVRLEADAPPIGRLST